MRQRLRRVRDASRHADDSRGFSRPRQHDCHRAVRLHALRDPTCAKVCPADAIKKTEDGVVQSSLKPRCIACSHCVLACPFGIPKIMTELEQMMKCDMCYDRTSEGKRPMCATVCPSQALTYVPREQIERTRREKPTNVFFFGKQRVTTKVFMMIPPENNALSVDVVDYMWETKP